MASVAIVDFRFGNLRSVHNALRRLAAPGDEVRITAEPAAIAQADRVVFPGQGAARACMRALREKGLATAVLEAARSRPFLGICMGLQVLLERSEENGGVDCLGLVAGSVRPFAAHRDRPAALKIPHMGWNRIRQAPHPLWEGVPDGSRFYFVHSYYAAPDDPAAVAGRAEYAAPFAAALARGPMFAMQCHPEKSGAHGLAVLRNFLRWDGRT